MAAPSAQALQPITAEPRLLRATLEKVLRLLDVLQATAEDCDVKTRVALTGSTALTGPNDTLRFVQVKGAKDDEVAP